MADEDQLENTNTNGAKACGNNNSLFSTNLF